MRRGGHEASFDYHRRMIEDVHRMDAYERALRARVRPGDVVLDLGCGTGILAMLAARCGAARVHAVESMPVARVARQLVAANGLEDRVFVHEADATRMAVIEPVDLVVSDFMGRLIVDDEMLDALAAAGRWLRPGGGFLPSRLRLHVAPVGGFRMPALDWVESSVCGVDLRPLAPYVQNESYGGDFHGGLLLAPPRLLGELVPPDPVTVLEGHLRFTLARAETLRGLIGWFDAELAPGVILTTGPDVETHWGQVLFPVPPVLVRPGDLVDARVRFVEEATWQYEWQVTVHRGDELVLEARLDTRDRPGERAVAPSPPPTGDPDEMNERGAAAWHAGRSAEALRLWEDAVRVLPARDRDSAPPIYENLGIAYLHQSQPLAAARAFLRALDGDPRSREQSLRLLVNAFTAAGRHADARRYQQLHDETFGTKER